MAEIDWRDIQINLPKSLALLHIGATSYYCFADSKVRNSHQSLRNRVHHWANSYSVAKKALVAVTLSTVAASVNAWRITQEPSWLVGGAVMFSIIPYHQLFLSKEEEVLNKDEERGKVVLDLP